jgi:hypothetical protein
LSDTRLTRLYIRNRPTGGDGRVQCAHATIKRARLQLSLSMAFNKAEAMQHQMWANYLIW